MGFALFLLFLLVLINAFTQASRMQQEQAKKLRDKIKDDATDYVVEETAKKNDFIVEDVKKFCPPHKWRYQEVRNTEGQTVRWRLICDLCGPLKSQNGPARLE